MIIRELVTRLGFQVDTSRLRAYERRMDRINTVTRRTTANLQAMGSSMRNVGLGLTAFVSAPLALIGRSLVNAASDAEEVNQRFNVVFRDLIKGANQVADAYAKDFGLARDESRELLGTTGDLLTGFGFSQEQALKLANQVGRLGGDLASFNNIQGGTAEAVTRLTKGILGETENLKLLGVVVNQTTKEFKDQVKSIMASEGLTMQAAKAQAIFNIAISQSKNAIGDFARTSDGYANKSRIFASRIRDLKVAFGEILLPAASAVLSIFTKVAEMFAKLPKPIKIAILTIAGIAAVVGPLILAAGLIVSSVTAIMASGPALAAFGALIAPIALTLLKVVAVLAVVGSAIWLLINDFNVWRKNGDSVLGVLLGRFDNFKEKVLEVVASIKSVFTTLWAAIKTNGEAEWNAFIDAFINAAIFAVKTVGKILIKINWIVKRISYEIGELLIKGIVRGFTRGFQLGKAAIKRIGGFGSTLINRVFGTQEQQTTSSALPTDPVQTLSNGVFASNRSNVQTNINQDIKLEVPAGTPEQQQIFIQESAEKIFGEMLNKEVTNGLMAVPQGEQ